MCFEAATVDAHQIASERDKNRRLFGFYQKFLGFRVSHSLDLHSNMMINFMRLRFNRLKSAPCYEWPNFQCQQHPWTSTAYDTSTECVAAIDRVDRKKCGIVIARFVFFFIQFNNKLCDRLCLSCIHYVNNGNKNRIKIICAKTATAKRKVKHLISLDSPIVLWTISSDKQVIERHRKIRRKNRKNLRKKNTRRRKEEKKSEFLMGLTSLFVFLKTDFRSHSLRKTVPFDKLNESMRTRIDNNEWIWSSLAKKKSGSISQSHVIMKEELFLEFTFDDNDYDGTSIYSQNRNLQFKLYNRILRFLLHDVNT